MFSNLSSSSISFATVTPSLVMLGEPNDLSSTTLRPFGPNVTFTASARVSTPLAMDSLAFWLYLISFAISKFPPLRLRNAESLLYDRNDVIFLHDEEFFAIYLDLGSGIFSEKHPIPLFYLQGDL